MDIETKFRRHPSLVRSKRQMMVAGLVAVGGWLGAAWRVLAGTGPVTREVEFGRASGVLLARIADPDIDPVGHLVSEKFDGVRGLWDGRVMRSRTGRPIAVPPDFAARLPPVPLDGELWTGHGRFDEVSALVRRRRPQPGDWASVRYMVFEMPRYGGRFDERAERLRELARLVDWPQFVAVEQSVVADRAALRVRLDEVLSRGGEGLMLHRADAPNLGGRSDVLLKLKPVHEEEAMVVGYTLGSGRLNGLVGALQVRNADGVAFLVGSGLPDVLRREPPPLGSLIIYASRGQTSHGVPRFATFVRVCDGP